MSILATARQTRPLTLLTTVSRTVGLASMAPWLPPGVALGGRLFRRGLDPAVGVPWLDGPGVLDVGVQLGYATAHRGGPSVSTLALRLPHPQEGEGGQADLVLHAGPRQRWVGGRRRSVHPGPGPLLTSVLPYAVEGRPIAFAVLACGAETFELMCAVDHEEWRSFADLRVCPRPVSGSPLDVDPVGNPLPGLRLTGPRDGRAVRPAG